MILIVFLIIHTLVVMGMYMLKVIGILKVDEEMFIMIICIPFWGAASALLITYLIRSGKVGSKNKDLEAMRGGFQDPQDLRVDTSEVQNIVPLEDALIMDDSNVRRSVMLDVLMSDAKGYMPVINQTFNIHKYIHIYIQTDINTYIHT